MPQKISTRQQAGVAFRARRNTTYNSTASGQSAGFVFDSITYNYGGGYSDSTGLFTAPVTGIYSFKFSAYTEPMTRAFWIPRGSKFTADPNGTGTRYNDLTAGTVARLLGHAEIHMNAGQTFGLDIWTASSINIATADTWFAGHLVMEV